MAPLTPADLAYMRGTQDEHHPEPMKWERRERVADGAGGRTWGVVESRFIRARFDTSVHRVPDYLAELATRGQVGQVAVPHDLPVSSGDRFIRTLEPRVLVVVSDGARDPWTTARNVYVVPEGVAVPRG